MGALDPLAVAIGYRYRSEAVLGSDGCSPVSPAALCGRPGTRAPHVDLVRAGRQMSTVELSGTRFVLLTSDANWARAGAAQPEVDLVWFGNDAQDPGGHWPGAFGLGPHGAMLVRPDGFVGWRSRASSDHPEMVVQRVLARLLSH